MMRFDAHVRKLGEIAMELGVVAGMAAAPLGTAPSNIASGIALGGLVLARPALLTSRIAFAGYAFAGWVVASWLITWLGGTSGSMSRFGIAYSWLLVIASASTGMREAARRRAYLAGVAGLTAAASLALVQFFVGYDADRPLGLSTSGRRFSQVSGGFGGYITFGGVCVLLLPAYLPAWPERPRARIVGAVAALLAIVISGARLALVGATAAIGAAIAARGRRWLAPAAGAALVVALLAIAALSVFTPSRMRTLVSADDGRLVIWRVAMQIVRDHPLIGTGGRKGFQAEYAQRYPAVLASLDHPPRRIEPQKPHAHNLELVLCSEHGVPALILYALLLAAILAAAAPRRRECPQDWQRLIGVIAAWVVAGQFNNLIGQGETSNAFYLVCGLAAAPLLAKPGSTPSIVAPA